MRRIFILLCVGFSFLAAGCGAYANSVAGDVSVPQNNGNNPSNLPSPNGVPKPNPPGGYAVSVSPVTIEEVALSGNQWVELFNASAYDADLGGWTLSDSFSGFTFPFGFHLPAGARVLIQLEQAGSDSAVQQFAPWFSRMNDQQGSVALLRAGGELMDFVQWGGASQPFESAAVQVGEWAAGDFVLAPVAGETMNYDGTANDSTAWRADTPTPGN
jgi:hypothetical protein